MNYKYLFGVFLFACIGLGLLQSCSKVTEEIDPGSFGYDYFPVATGKSWTYMSDSVIIRSSGLRRDTMRSFIREEIGERYKDAEGKDVYKVFRSFRKKDTDAWQSLNTWTVQIDQNRAIRTEENLKFIKLIFPFSKGMRWDGNAFIDTDIRVQAGDENIQPYKNWKYRIENTEAEITFKGQKTKALKVNLVSDTSIIDLRNVTEFYGKGVGLIRKEMTIFDTDNSKPTAPWSVKAQKGFTHTLTLIDFK
ncbi:MAG: hypothetical protein KA341_06385 [Saprospiraceae bacterium]|nr:hypothetical protein [Saprospiraceae bacterium]